MEDRNASIGEEQVREIIGNFELGCRNERGERLIECCTKHKLVVANTPILKKKVHKEGSRRCKKTTNRYTS